MEAISKLYSNQLGNRVIDPLTEILVTNGAREALLCAIVGHLKSGDEVIIIEPFFDGYESMVRLAGAPPVFIPLRTVNFEFMNYLNYNFNNNEFQKKSPKEGNVSNSSDWVLHEEESQVHKSYQSYNSKYSQ